ncbi:copper chaperone PCu(A)C [Rhodoblastus acidophilus]|uniref:Copper chaperone PCu(A)C n=1 Tax=Candidatus Rhodoblastus alkanivorans TaxID=2954117 RepID=A0ABS9Z745_9HYPH|nr:copper chaperone PCu(A)C [Candidatus Rhodoblastus alkanivorans]MCI4678736.1 copper chaperone PCu(A)C [Candidatus Rhodoblastus alkanivorans]MCI4683468.1 copper chaperone PCu(A)C [Candidatus Rhodoblastus alkanivorans]MDI4640782.1 copper chaperone PCu(A)C [Rhodoblastus acidophilus]
MKVLQKCAVAALLATAAAAPAFAQGGAVTIAQPWSRATPGGATTGAVYMTIENKSAAEDRLTGASSDVAAKTEIHEMKMVNGVMEMRGISGGLAVPAHGSVAFKPGGYHVMLIGLKKPLKAGETVPLTLDFAKAGKIEISARVQAMTSPPPKMNHMKMH